MTYVIYKIRASKPTKNIYKDKPHIYIQKHCEEEFKKNPENTPQKFEARITSQ